MSQIQEGMITFEEFKNPQNLQAFGAFLQSNGTAAVCDNESYKPMYMVVYISNERPLMKSVSSIHPMHLGFALIKNFLNDFGERGLKMLAFKEKTVDLLKMMETTSATAATSIDESFDHMMDFLSQIGNFNNA